MLYATSNALRMMHCGKYTANDALRMTKPPAINGASRPIGSSLPTRRSNSLKTLCAMPAVQGLFIAYLRRSSPALTDPPRRGWQRGFGKASGGFQHRLQGHNPLEVAPRKAEYNRFAIGVY